MVVREREGQRQRIDPIGVSCCEVWIFDPCARQSGNVDLFMVKWADFPIVILNLWERDEVSEVVGMRLVFHFKH